MNPAPQNAPRPLRAHWVCRDRFGSVRIRAVDILSISRATRDARVAINEGGRRIERAWPVPFAELASSPQKAVRMALSLVHAGDKNFPPPARPIEHTKKCTKTAPAAGQF